MRRAPWMMNAACALVLVSLSLACSAALADDWLQTGYDAAHHGFNPAEHTLGPGNVATLSNVGHIALPEPVAGSGVFLSGVETPAGSRDLLFLTSIAGTLLALDTQAMVVLWSQHTGDAYIHSAPVIDPNRRYVYSFGAGGLIHKYAVGDGAESLDQGWPQIATLKAYYEHAASGLTIGETAAGARFLYAVTDGYFGDGGDYQGHLTTINLDTGEQKVFNALCSDVAIHFIDGGQPGVNDCAARRAGIWGRPGATFDAVTGRVYVVTGNGIFDALMGGHNWGDSVLALSADGTGAVGGPLDSYTPTNYQELDDRDIDLGAGSVAIIGTVPGAGPGRYGVVMGKDGTTRLLSLDDLSGAGAPGNVGGELQTVGPNYVCKCTMPQPAVVTAPDGSIWIYVIPTELFSAYEVVAVDGQPQLQERWSTNIFYYPAQISSPVVANGVVYVVTSAARAYDAATGALLWQTDTQFGGGARRSSPLVVNGRLYVISENAVDIFATDVILADGFDARAITPD